MLCRVDDVCDGRRMYGDATVGPFIDAVVSSIESGLKRTRLCDDNEPSFALRYVLSSLVKLSGGVGFVGVVI